MSSQFPYEVVPLPPGDQEELLAKFQGKRKGFGVVKEVGQVLPLHYKELANDYYNFKFEADDVVIMTNPKCGTTWMQEIVWIMRNNLDFEGATTISSFIRSPFFEYDSIKHPDMSAEQKVLDTLANAGVEAKKGEEYLSLTRTVSRPRTIKTHLRFSLMPPSLPDTCKVVYVARNPRDACVSFFHHNRLFKLHNFTGDFACFLDFWCRDLLLHSPFWSHLEEAWSKRDHPNVHIIFFEDMKKDMLKELRRLNAFLGTKLTDDQLEKVKEFTSFGNMKSRGPSNVRPFSSDALNPNEGEFIRKGSTGGWKDYFTPELEVKFAAWMDKWKHIASGVPFEYEI